MSTITVYGATGMVGSAIAAEAVRRGHRVVGVSRGGTPDNPIDGVDYVTGQIGDAADVVAKAEKTDAIVFAVPGPRDGSPVQPIIDAHAAIVPALAAAGVAARVFVVGGAGATLADDGTRLVDAPDFPDAAKPESLSFAEILEMYRKAPESVDWVMLAPAPTIAPGEPAAGYQLGDDHPAGSFVTSGTFAKAALDELENPAHRRVRFTVAER